jgi:hypothetical protein
MFCPSCGAENEANAQFCQGCGANMSQASGGAGGPSTGTPPPPPPRASTPPPTGQIDLGGWVSKAFTELNSDIGAYIIIGVVFGIVTFIPLVNLVLLGPMLAGAYYVLRRKLAGKGKADIGEIFSQGFTVFVPALLIVIIPGIIVGAVSSIPYIGWIVGFVAGPLLLPFFAFSLHYIMEEKKDFVPAGQAAWDIIQKNILNFWLLGLVTGFVSWIGLIVCGIGIFYTYPVGLIIMSYMLDAFLPLKS